jgi:hypothetical protein
MKPIPPLTFGALRAGGLDVQLEGAFTYPVATSLLRRVLKGREVKQSGKTVRVADVHLSGIGGGRVALGVDLTGDVRGRIYFAGTPVIDTAARQVAVPDLDYDLGSANLLVAGLRWLKGNELRDLLRERARLPDSAAVGRLVPLAERGMNRQITDGVVLRADIEEAQGLRVRATTRDIRVYAHASGSAHLTITKELQSSKGDAATRPMQPNPFRLPKAK